MRAMGLDMGGIDLLLLKEYAMLFLEKMMPQGYYPRPTAEQRFWKKVKKTESCWLWIGALLKDGYGNFNETRKTIPAHRFAYKTLVGPIPQGMLVRHSCDTPACVRPDHLVLGTQKDNCQDALIRGRNVRGESHGMCKITSLMAHGIKEALASGRTIRDVSLEFGVGFYTVADISRGKTWREA